MCSCNCSSLCLHPWLDSCPGCPLWVGLLVAVCVTSACYLDWNTTIFHSLPQPDHVVRMTWDTHLQGTYIELHWWSVLWPDEVKRILRSVEFSSGLSEAHIGAQIQLWKSSLKGAPQRSSSCKYHCHSWLVNVLVGQRPWSLETSLCVTKTGGTSWDTGNAAQHKEHAMFEMLKESMAYHGRREVLKAFERSTAGMQRGRWKDIEAP